MNYSSKYLKPFLVSLVLVFSVVLFSSIASAAPPLTYYWDDDFDTYGDPGISKKYHPPPPSAQWVLNSDDCDDTDVYINPDTIWYKDVDGDGHSDGTSQGPQCTRPTDYYYEQELTAISGDCDDSDGNVYPGASEICGNEIDNDCNGYVDEIKVPGDYSTIQAGINAASASGCDLVLVSDGTYYENIDFNGKAITVQSVNGKDYTTIDASSSGSVVTFDSGETTSSVLDGFTIQNGTGTLVTSLYYGGGIYCDSSSPTITNCTITSNTVSGKAGGIYCNNGSSPEITNCTISSNSATHAAGIYCYSSSPTITDCTISDNTATEHGGGIYCYSSSPTITGCTITGNAGNDAGAGGILCQGGSPTITDCTITGNTAYQYGGGIYITSSSSPTITNCTISENTAGDYGGGIYGTSSVSPTITNCTINDNSASQGGGINFRNYSTPEITNCTISNNSATYQYGGGIHCATGTSAVVVNSILWGDTAEVSGDEIYLDGTSSIDITYSDIEGGWTGTGNINSDPLFVDDTNADPGLRDYHLSTVNSPCVDYGTSSGAPSDDIDGESRPNGSGDDMGSDEYYAP
jgi:parallel beta-helix repeat protein